MTTAKLILAFLASIILAGTASARIGETKAQCDARYGKPSRTKDGFSHYIHNYYMITVLIARGRCQVINYEKHDIVATMVLLLKRNGVKESTLQQISSNTFTCNGGWSVELGTGNLLIMTALGKAILLEGNKKEAEGL